jgi:hypothetical protein
LAIDRLGFDACDLCVGIFLRDFAAGLATTNACSLLLCGKSDILYLPLDRVTRSLFGGNALICRVLSNPQAIVRNLILNPKNLFLNLLLLSGVIRSKFSQFGKFLLI